MHKYLKTEGISKETPKIKFKFDIEVEDESLIYWGYSLMLIALAGFRDNSCGFFQ